MIAATKAVPIEGIVSLSIGGREVSARKMVARPVIIVGGSHGWERIASYREPDRLHSFLFAWPGWEVTQEERTHLRAGPHTLSMRAEHEANGGPIEWWYEAVTFVLPTFAGYWPIEHAEFAGDVMRQQRERVECIGSANYVEGPSSHPFMREQDPDAERTLGGFWRVPEAGEGS